MSVVDSAVSPLALCMHARHCQQMVPLCPSMPCPRYLAASRPCMAFGAAVARWCEVLPVGRPQTRPRPSAHPASRLTQLAPLPHIADDAAITIAHHWSVHVPALSVALQADPRQGSAQCCPPCASTHSPFSRIRGRVVYRSRSQPFPRKSKVVVPVHCVAGAVYRSRLTTATRLRCCGQDELAISHVQQQSLEHGSHWCTLLTYSNSGIADPIRARPKQHCKDL
jgi:hypothetical protein